MKKAPIEVMPEIKEEPLPTKSDESQITPQEEKRMERLKKLLNKLNVKNVINI